MEEFPNDAGDLGRSMSDFKKSRRRKMNLVESNFDRLPPHSLESEQGALGCMIMSPTLCIQEAVTFLRMGSEAMYDLRHRALYECLVSMANNGQAIDLITIQQKLRDEQKLEGVGGLAYIAALPDTVPSAAHLSFYLEILREKYILRRAIQVCTKVVSEAYENPSEINTFLSDMERQLMELSVLRMDQKKKDIKTLVINAWHEIEARQESDKVIEGIATGYPDLDKITNGLCSEDLIILAARASVGKTSKAMNIVRNIAVGQNIPVGVFSLEMSAESLVLRLMATESGLNFAYGTKLDNQEIETLGIAASRIQNSPIHIEDRVGMNIMEIRATARMMVANHGVKIFAVDYLGIINSVRNNGKRSEVVGEICWSLKEMARELKVPVLVLCQLDRSVTKEKRAPTIADLRESGKIEEHADKIILLHAKEKEETEGQRTLAIDCQIVQVNVDKNRNGRTGPCRLMFFKNISRFESCSKIDEPEIKEEFPDAPTDQELSDWTRKY